MKITKSYGISENEARDSVKEITAEGSMERSFDWVPIETLVKVSKETENAYFGNVTVYECDSVTRILTLFEKTDTWIPKSMSDNPWWICTNLFEYKEKVANKRFEDDFW